MAQRTLTVVTIIHVLPPLRWQLRALTEAVCKLVDSAVDRLGEAKRRRRRKAVPTSVPPLTRDQLAAVKAAIVAAARKAGLSESRTDVIAKATVSRLVLAPAEAEKGRNSEAAS